MPNNDLYETLATRRQRLARNLQLIDQEQGDGTPPSVSVPIKAFAESGKVVMIRTFLFQMVIAAGFLVTALGLGEDSMLVRLLRFSRTDEAVPLLTALATAIAVGWQLLRGLRKHRDGQTLSLLPGVPDAVAEGPANPPAAVAKAVEAATVVIDQQSAPDARPASATDGPPRDEPFPFRA
jgi:hypothetical protein